MTDISTFDACEFKLSCLKIANNTGLEGENSIAYAKDMFAWVMQDVAIATDDTFKNISEIYSI